MNARLTLLFLLFVSMWLGIVFRGTSLKLFPEQRLLQQKQRQFSRSITVPARRGTIFDSRGKELAVSVPSYSLFADPKLIQDKNNVARFLADQFEKPYQWYRKKIKSKTRRFVWLHRKLDKEAMRKVEAFQHDGLGFVEEPKRVYPNTTLLSQVLGFLGREGQGLGGIEYRYDQQLQGEKRQRVVPRDARGRPLVGDARLLVDHESGLDLTLSVDSEVQYFLENQLLTAIEEHEAESAVGVILSAQTSEVVAMASVPGADANKATMYTPEMRRNRAIASAFEPGSTMKTFIVAAGLQHELVKPSTPIDCEGGRMRVGKRWISEADSHHQFDVLSVNEVLSQSSNVGAAKIGFRLGDKKVHSFLKDLGFGAKSKVGLPGENSGILHTPPWRKHLLSNVSFGHGVSATPVQIATAYAAIANGGIYRQPKIIKQIENSMTGEVALVEPPSERRVVSEEVASTMTLMLTQATSEQGTGAAARVPGYPVAGKTGTAQKVDPQKGGYLEGKYISSFAGFIPSHDPRFVIYIAVDSPKKDYYGSQVAAPVFAKVGSYLMRKTGISPAIISKENVIQKDLSDEQKAAIKKIKKIVDNEDKAIVPELRGLSLREALQTLKGRAASIQIKGQGRVYSMDPKPGEKISSKQTLRLKLSMGAGKTKSRSIY